MCKAPHLYLQPFEVVQGSTGAETRPSRARRCAVSAPHAAAVARHRAGRWCSNGSARRVRAAQWLENSAEQEVGVPLEAAYAMWEDRQRIPQWMPWISSVQVQPDDERLSKWTLSTEQFGRRWEFSWLAQNLTPTPLQKIHWRSVQGSTGGSLGSGIDIANRGQIRFYRKSPASCAVKLTISYEVPDVLAPFAGAVTPIVENILSTDLGRFAKLAEAEARSS